jgi:hypothetical protein
VIIAHMHSRNDGQMNTLQEQQVVHLQPHGGAIRLDFGGKLLELLNAPAVIYLPMAPPKLDSHGNPWSVDIRSGPWSSHGRRRVSIQLAKSSLVRLCTSSRTAGLTR